MTETGSGNTGRTDAIDELFLLGVGVLSLAKERFDVVAEDLVERGRASRADGRSLVSELRERGMCEKDAIAQLANQRGRKVAEMAGLASKDEVDALQAEVAQLKRELGAAKPKRAPRAAAKAKDA